MNALKVINFRKFLQVFNEKAKEDDNKHFNGHSLFAYINVFYLKYYVCFFIFV